MQVAPGQGPSGHNDLDVGFGNAWIDGRHLILIWLYCRQMKNIDTQHLIKLIDAFIQERDWEQFHSPKNLAMALSVESSELLEIFQWMKEEDSLKLKENPAILSKVEDELADIFYYLLRLSSKAEVDLSEALIRKMKKNAEKYPASQVKGSSKKYDEY